MAKQHREGVPKPKQTVEICWSFLGKCLLVVSRAMNGGEVTASYRWAGGVLDYREIYRPFLEASREYTSLKLMKGNQKDVYHATGWTRKPSDLVQKNLPSTLVLLTWVLKVQAFWHVVTSVYIYCFCIIKWRS